MTGKSNFYANAILNALKGTPFSMANLYIGLLAALPADAGSPPAEVAGGDYARLALALGEVADRAVSNSADLLFAVASAPWGTVVGFALYDAAQNGNWLYADNLTVAKQIDAQDQLKIAAGDLDLSEV